ncbi:hypothetical protein FHS27_003204 [Rhodopirellula rubra]|uniref:Uncharacterized protein n=1 Tax=Aporhodopirellula rubra TaxID=980271 RepID=A0A7W5H6J2_9BACT|nr:hypothetical protein [Aporhodopirellula rubra]
MIAIDSRAHDCVRFLSVGVRTACGIAINRNMNGQGLLFITITLVFGVAMLLAKLCVLVQ